MQMFESVYPGVEKWINEVHRVIGKSQFACLLQRCESYLMLNVVAREFHQMNSEAPVFSIHDALLTYEQYLPELAGIVKDRFKEICGVKVGIKVDQPPEVPRIDRADVNEIWKEILPVKTEKRYLEMTGSVLSSNIERGLKFLKN
jgi:hypothetical protein